MQLTWSNMRTGTNSNWQGVLSAGDVSQLPHKPADLGSRHHSADLLYSQLFPVRASASDQTRVDGGRLAAELHMEPT